MSQKTADIPQWLGPPRPQYLQAAESPTRWQGRPGADVPCPYIGWGHCACRTQVCMQGYKAAGELTAHAVGRARAGQGFVMH